MNWKNQLTRTPYLVLFIVLLTVGVGTASALITITLAGDVHITGDTTIDGELGVGTGNPSDDDKIWFDDGNEFLMWDDSQSQFEIRDDIVTGDVIQSGNAGPNAAYNRIGIGNADSGVVTANDDLYIKGDLETDGDIYCPNCIDPSDLSRFGSASLAITNGDGGTGCYIGEVRLFAGSVAPAGWLPAEGQTLLISQHNALFSLLGTTYGGNGTTEFNLPDISDINPKSANGSGLNYVICTVGIFP